ncbi:MAG: hypothetical protein HY556_01415 [Euryarchaeota archaeon]|nr:hypothetical protein [Euryarchaeota archaeon]
MTVKDRVGRNRYIVFKVEPTSTPKRDVQGSILGVLSRHVSGLGPAIRKPALIAYEEGVGILRVPHIMKGDAIDALTGITWAGRPTATVTVTTLGTSGTIRAAQRFVPRGRRTVLKPQE